MASTERLLVADTGPLLALARVDGLVWLADCFGEILVPRVVWKEAQHHPGRADAKALRTMIKTEPAFKLCASAVHPSLSDFPLGAGERAAISVALRRGAWLFLDDRAARVTARSWDLPVIGTLGVLVMAKRRGRLSEVAPVIRRLRASGYFLGPALVRETLRVCGEV
ncbi:DUF3368 domain-containing protein [Algiphilus sp.]|uniref:DUF3368 domain-containing protein n=1 Tax=Algiphilus sp. TaxID=1872431 RepID=UPI0025C3ADE8|nr:DUF3368 domain-containing protein [Algiphilus sp.]MCK5771750.1 DUF3368 domain-containing protein [Algiphilus sp.]